MLCSNSHGQVFSWPPYIPLQTPGTPGCLWPQVLAGHPDFGPRAKCTKRQMKKEPTSLILRPWKTQTPRLRRWLLYYQIQHKKCICRVNGLIGTGALLYQNSKTRRAQRPLNHQSPTAKSQMIYYRDGNSRVLVASGGGWASRLRATGQMHQTANKKRTDLAYIKALANADPQTS